VITPLEDGASIWSAINSAENDITLQGGYTLAQFQANLTQLKSVYQQITTAVTEEKLARGARNETQDD
jgi:hypothetical protein